MKFVIATLAILGLYCCTDLVISVADLREIKEHHSRMEVLQQAHYEALEEIMVDRGGALPDGFMRKRTEEEI